MKNNVKKKDLEAIAEAPEEVRKDWSKTQQFIAQVIEDLKKETKLGSFEGDVDNGTD